MFTLYLRRLRLSSIECNYDSIAEDAEKKVKEQSTLIGECDEQLIRRLLGKIKVYEEKFTIEFKSGVEVEAEI